MIRAESTSLGRQLMTPLIIELRPLSAGMRLQNGNSIPISQLRARLRRGMSVIQLLV